ncbi:unnamed protein product [Darwinula stevensoni]|uniref:Poly(A)-specific ribonuclease RNA-binding domain-containing protein n=1 Tax=Darwinula stevensoni TaxID=69355 RepID=A0A7R8X6N3_9CRUS|nr:unnamed protein product [Darwinula stevensoni]CAG0881662.1 unnamed protein product [Darwinula stevensoni]
MKSHPLFWKSFSDFIDELDGIKEIIQGSDFLALDLEFTGLRKSMSGGLKNNLFDSISDRLKKMQENMMEFLVLQVGLCAFHWVPEARKWKYYAYNFNVFPSAEHGDLTFPCQVETMKFLLEHGFDFNRVILEGIPFLRPDREEKAKRSFFLKQKAILGQGPSPQRVSVPEKLKPLIVAISERVKNFLDDPDAGQELNLGDFTAYHRKLIYEEIHERFQGQMWVESVPGKAGETEILLHRGKEGLENWGKEPWKKLQNAFEFRKLIDFISSSEKLLIGHNMLLDLLHLEEKFHQDIPQEYGEMKHLLHTRYPKILDMKLVAEWGELADLFMDSSLKCMAIRLSKEPFQCAAVAPGNEVSARYEKKEAFHEAGYDAFLTGQNFLSVLQYLNHMDSMVLEVSFKSCLFPLALDFTPKSSLTILLTVLLLTFVSLAILLMDRMGLSWIFPFIALIVAGVLAEHGLPLPGFLLTLPVALNLLRTLYTVTLWMFRALAISVGVFPALNIAIPDVPYINLAGPDMSPDRSHVFHLKMPSSWKNQDIEELFSAVGPVQIAWIDDTSAYIALKRREMAAEALTAKIPHNDSLYQVTTYADFCAESLFDCKRRGEKRQKLEEINS